MKQVTVSLSDAEISSSIRGNTAWLCLSEGNTISVKPANHKLMNELWLSSFVGDPRSQSPSVKWHFSLKSILSRDEPLVEPSARSWWAEQTSRTSGLQLLHREPGLQIRRWVWTGKARSSSVSYGNLLTVNLCPYSISYSGFKLLKSNSNACGLIVASGQFSCSMYLWFGWPTANWIFSRSKNKLKIMGGRGRI